MVTHKLIIITIIPTATPVVAMRTAEAEGMKKEAEGRRALNEAIGENLIRFEAIRRVGEAKVPNINVGSDAIRPLMNVVQQAFGGGAQPTPTPAN